MPSAFKSAFSTLRRATSSSRCKVGLSSTGCQADAGNLRPPSKAHAFALSRFPHYRVLWSAGIVRAKDERVGELVDAAVHDDLACLGLFGAPHCLTRAFEGAKCASTGSGIGVAAIGCDIESAFGLCGQTGERYRQAASQEFSV